MQMTTPMLESLAEATNTEPEWWRHQMSLAAAGDGPQLIMHQGYTQDCGCGCSATVFKLVRVGQGRSKYIEKKLPTRFRIGRFGIGFNSI